MKIAVAHEWLTNWAGSERVVHEIVQLTDPVALIASVVDYQFANERFPGQSIRGLWPTRLPGATQHWSRYAAAMIAAWPTTKVRADALIASSHFAAHGAALRFDGPSLVYYHTPMRMVWRPDLELSRLRGTKRQAIERVLPLLRAWDRRVAQAPTRVLANSTAVAQRIQMAYARQADVVHPPVEVERWQALEYRKSRHLLFFGRLVAYKAAGIAIAAATRLNQPMVVVGDGPDRADLEAQAGPNVRFLGHVSDSELQEVVCHASAMVFPGEEDFGIGPVEVLAAGVPVVAYGAGGALDYIEHGRNGVLVKTQLVSDFIDGIKLAADTDWDRDVIRASVTQFSAETFRERFRSVLDTTFDGWRDQVP